MAQERRCNIGLEQNGYEQRHGLHSLQNTDQIKTEMGAPYMEKTETHTGFWWENLKERATWKIQAQMGREY